MSCWYAGAACERDSIRLSEYGTAFHAWFARISFPVPPGAPSNAPWSSAARIPPRRDSVGSVSAVPSPPPAEGCSGDCSAGDNAQRLLTLAARLDTPRGRLRAVRELQSPKFNEFLSLGTENPAGVSGRSIHDSGGANYHRKEGPACETCSTDGSRGVRT